MKKNKHYFKTYHELETAIKINTIHLTCFQFEKDEIISTTKDSDKLKRINNEITFLKSVITKQEEELKKMQNAIRELSHILNLNEINVFILHHIDRLPLTEVADKLKFSYSYIREINADVLKKML